MGTLGQRGAAEGGKDYWGGCMSCGPLVPSATYPWLNECFSHGGEWGWDEMEGFWHEAEWVQMILKALLL